MEDRGSALCLLCPSWPGSASSVSPVPVVPDPHPVPQLSRAILPSPATLPTVGQTELPLLLQSLPRHLEGFGLLDLHLTLPSRGMSFKHLILGLLLLNALLIQPEI